MADALCCTVQQTQPIYHALIDRKHFPYLPETPHVKAPLELFTAGHVATNNVCSRLAWGLFAWRRGAPSHGSTAAKPCRSAGGHVSDEAVGLFARPHTFALRAQRLPSYLRFLQR